MLPITLYPSPEAERKLARIATRRIGADPALESSVQAILDEVHARGDAALIRYVNQFDAPDLTVDRLSVSQSEIEQAYDAVDASYLTILRAAMDNVRSFHAHQLQSSHFVTRPDGTFLGQMVLPVASAGLYIPGGKGGTTPLISSVLMNGIPARLAGVADLAMVTPPRRDGTIDPHLLVAAGEVGISRIHRLGSAWAVAALAFGTPAVPRVDVIVGPGNIYVALAKKLVSGRVGIDMLAGPSEVLVIADGHAVADYIAADLLAQAEHDPMAGAVLIATDRELGECVAAALQTQLAHLPRREVAELSLSQYGAIFLVESLDAAFDLANRIAPEHLEIQVQDPWLCLGKVRNAGAVFLGGYTPEAVGDYFAGPNHVLPTAGTARFASALGVEDFLKKTSVIAYSREALHRDAPAIIRLAELEGLEAHARSVRVRLERERN